MGKKARQRRSEEKKLAKVLNFTLEATGRILGFKENELGELTAVMTKAEVRRRFIRYRAVCAEMLESIRNFDPRTLFDLEAFQRDLFAELTRRVQEEIDAQILGELLASV